MDGAIANARPGAFSDAFFFSVETIMALLLLLGAMASAHAQIGGGHGRRQNNQQQTPQRSPAPTTPFLPEIWPRLEEGALICKSRGDFVRYQTQIANGLSATTPGQG